MIVNALLLTRISPVFDKHIKNKINNKTEFFTLKYVAFVVIIKKGTKLPTKFNHCFFNYPVYLCVISTLLTKKKKTFFPPTSYKRNFLY